MRFNFLAVVRRYFVLFPFAFASVCLLLFIKSCIFFGLGWVGSVLFEFDWIGLS